jgi:HPt (histidine-containing phosphotransfer) domain-containing protein
MGIAANMTTNPPQAVNISMTDALGRLWTKFLPDIERRVGLLGAAARAAATGELSDDQREGAHAAAHKLAGTLGTFGLPHGTALARKAENLLAGVVTLADAADLASWVTELNTLLADRK